MVSPDIFLVAPYQVEGVRNASVLDCYNYISTKKVLGIDIETTRAYPRGKYNESVYKGGLDPYLSDVVMLQLGDLERVFVIDTRFVNKEELQPVLDFLQYNDNVILTGQNVKFECKHLRHKYGLRFKKVWDCMLVEMVLYNGLPMKYGLADMAGRYLGIPKHQDALLFDELYDKVKVTMDAELLEENEHLLTPFEVADEYQIDKSTRMEFLTIGDKPFTKKQILYGSDDIIHPLLIRERQMLGRKISENDHYCPVNCIKIENTFSQVLGDIELQGMRVDQKLWLEIAEENEIEYERRKKELDAYVCELYPQFASQPDLFSDVPLCHIQWSSSQQVVRFLRKLELCPRAYSKQTGREEWTAGAKELTKKLPNKYKTMYMKNKWVSFERDEAGRAIEDHDRLLLAILNLNKSFQAITTFGRDWLKYIHPITGKVHSSYRQILNTGRISSTNPNCFSLDTKLLTKKGWKAYNEIEVGDRILTYNMEKRVIEEQEVEAHYVGEGELLEFTGNRNFDGCMTPDHRQVVLNSNKKLVIKEAKDVSNYDHIINAGLMYEGIDEPELFIRLICATQADGYSPETESHYKSGRERVFKNYYYDFTKERKAIRLRETLTEYCAQNPDHQLEWKEREEIKAGVLTYRFTVVYPIDFFREYLEEKHFTWKLMDMSYQSRRYFYDELFYWDGLFTRKNNYNSCVKINLEIAQAIAVTVGVRARFREYTWNQEQNPNNSINYQVDFAQKDFCTIAGNKTESIGVHPIWCVKVPNGTVIASRGVSVWVSGNCQQISNGKWRKAFIVDEGEQMVCLDYAAQELRILADKANETTMLNFFMNGDPVFGEDLHSFSATRIEKLTTGNPEAFIPPKELSDGSDNPDFKPEHNESRNKSKSISFGIAYGKSSFADDFGCSEDEAEEFVRGYLDVFKMLEPFFEQAREDSYRQGYILIDDFSGRRWFSNDFEKMNQLYEEGMKPYREPEYRAMSREEREEWKAQYKEENPWFRQIWRDWNITRSALGRKSQNYKIQGLAGGQTKTAANMLRHREITENLPISICNLIHDETLVINREPDRGHEIGKIVQECMEKGGNLFCKHPLMKASYKLGTYWIH